MTELEKYFAEYHPTAEQNDSLWTAFQGNTNSMSILKEHRDWVEQNSWGFGDRAFHYMWYLILRDDVLNRAAPELLEIGVYKGQVISLWTLIAAHLQRTAAITAVSPFESATPWFSKNRALNRAAQMFSKRYRDDVRSANLHDSADYLACIHQIFRQFGLSEEHITYLRGFSQDSHVYEQLANRLFDVIYIDGGHRYEQVLEDLTKYSRLVRSGGYLVLDDASCNQPGSRFWKGHESVSRAVADWGSPGFTNVLNVGHNGVYRRDASDTGPGTCR